MPHTEPLPLHRVRSRISAFVYGNFVVLGAVLAATQEQVASGRAVLVVGVTAATTFVAHVVADSVAEQIDPPAARSRRRAQDEIRDAAPVATSASVPVVVFGLAALGLVPSAAAQWIAVVIVVARLAATGYVVNKVSGRPASPLALWSGFGLAVIGFAVSLIKTLVSH